MGNKAGRRIPLYLVDAFTDKPFRGNPAAVCLMEDEMDDHTLQAIAAENNLSETAFLWAAGGGHLRDAEEFHLRWFTPVNEVPLCGHATLATSAVLFDALEYPGDVIAFRTLSGRLQAERHPDGILLDFPADEVAPFDPPAGLLEAMGVDDAVEVLYTDRGKDVLVRLASAAAVRNLDPDFRAMVESTRGTDINGAMVTAEGEPPYDFVSRFFAPWWGIDEDPVTGAAHTILAPYWAERLGRRVMRAHQASNRGGDLTVEVVEGGRVHLIGRAVIVMEGTLFPGR
jgi:PhzF family phenazine biosynthesis protein